MKEKIVNDLKNKLINIKCNSEIGKILYDKSIESGSFDIFIPAIEDVKQLFKDIINHLDIYSSACKKSYEEKYGYSFDEKEKDFTLHNGSIFGHGSINVIKDDKKLKIILECE